jgi:hypothetical protein
MERRRVAGYITKQVDRDFGVDVPVRPTVPSGANPGFEPSGNPIPDGQTGLDPREQKPFTKKFRDLIPPGVIGSDDGEDLDKLGPPQYVDTVPYQRGEQNNVELHGAVNMQKVANPVAPEIPFNEYASFQPRSAPMPRAVQDEGFLERYGYNKADPLMTDYDSNVVILPRDAGRIDLASPNRDGMPHNDNRGGNVVSDAAQGVSEMLGDTVGSGIKAANKFIDSGGPTPGKTAQALRPPKPPAGWDRKTER